MSLLTDIRRVSDFLRYESNPPRVETPDWSARKDDALADLAWAVMLDLKREYGIDPKKVSLPDDGSGRRLSLATEDRLKYGNMKLKGILIWDLPAVTTCPVCATCKKDCYAMSAQGRPSVFYWRFSNLFIWSKHREWLEESIERQLLKPKCQDRTDFRLHSSGDFFSQEYIDWWARIVARHPEKKWYAYTKADEVFDMGPLVRAGLNIVKSNIPTGGVPARNFGPPDYVAKVYEQAKRGGLSVLRCPATYRDGIPCGERRHGGHCRWCIDHEYTLFVEHGTQRSKARGYYTPTDDWTD